MRIALLVAAITALSPIAMAQTPRTADGHPDLGGTWGTAFLTPLERPPGADAVIHPDKAAAFAVDFRSHVPAVIDPDFQVQDIHALAKVNGELRSGMIVEPADGQIPFTPKALKAMEHYLWADENEQNDPEGRSSFDRCLAGMGQAPIRQLPAMIPSLIVQTPGNIAIATEDVASLRVIHMDGRAAPPAAVRTFEGWSAGRWEGDTLVVETTHSRADDLFRGGLGRPLMVEPDSKVIERFTRLSPTEMHYDFTVIDPDLYTKPWRAEYVFTLQHTPFYEYAGHEGNYAMTNILLGGRVKDWAAARTPKASAKAKPKAKR
jgi:hypothetical protein